MNGASGGWAFFFTASSCRTATQQVLTSSKVSTRLATLASETRSTTTTFASSAYRLPSVLWEPWPKQEQAESSPNQEPTASVRDSVRAWRSLPSASSTSF